MKILHYIKSIVFYQFLSDLYKSNRLTFYVICFVAMAHICANVIKSNIFPVFIYGMYSEPQGSMPSTTSRYVFFADSKLIPIHNLFIEGRISAPISKYLNFKYNGKEIPIIDKRSHYLSYILPVRFVSRLKALLYAKCIDLRNFKGWYMKYFAQYIHIKMSRLSIYKYEYNIDQLDTPIKTTYLFSIYE